jgi:hypothetical protein
MSSKDYQTGAIYDNEALARLAFEAIVDLPLSHPDITLLEPDHQDADSRSVQAARHYLGRVIRDALPAAGKGAGAGAGIGGIGAVLLAAHSPALFVSAPILFGLTIATWGAWIGGAIGAGIALELRADTLASVLDAASRSGHWCLLIHTRNSQDHDRVLKLLSRQPDVRVAEGRKTGRLS